MSVSAEILKKVQGYCAYQERCQQEVRLKLSAMGVRGEEAELIISELISGNFINEERYARSFARGKFRLKKWGKRKIENALKQKKISSFCIRKGISEINESEYKKLIHRLANDPPPKTDLEKMARIRKLISKGFESDLVKNAIGFELEDH